MARTYHSQHNPKYKKEKLGTCTDTIYNSGCALVSIANRTDNDPSELNGLFKTTGVYSNGCMIDFGKAASRLGYTYKKQSNNPKVRCIAETDHYKSKGVPQHFFLLKPDKSIVDPLDYPATFKQNPYHIVSYRVFTKIDLPEDPKEQVICDLSHWNNVTNWDKLKDAFVIHKCTQGTGYLDPTYKERKDKIQASYHFADGGDPVKEAEWFVKNSNEPMLILDWEIDHDNPVEWCTKFIKVVEQMTGKDCWFYTNDARVLKYDWPKNWKKWIARYKDYSGDLDYNYQPKSYWDMWQYTSRGKLDGVEGNVDLNVSKTTLPKIEAVSGDNYEVVPDVPESIETPPSKPSEATDGLKFDWEKQAWIVEKNWLQRLVEKILDIINNWIQK